MSIFEGAGTDSLPKLHREEERACDIFIQRAMNHCIWYVTDETNCPALVEQPLDAVVTLMRRMCPAATLTDPVTVKVF